MKIVRSNKRIIDFYNHFDGNVYVAFSGGKDSTVLLDLVRKIYPDVPGVFVDTGLEYPEIGDYAVSTLTRGLPISEIKLPISKSSLVTCVRYSFILCSY